MTEKVNPYHGQKLRKVDFVSGRYDKHPEPAADIEEANLVTSEFEVTDTARYPIMVWW